MFEGIRRLKLYDEPRLRGSIFLIVFCLQKVNKMPALASSVVFFLQLLAHGILFPGARSLVLDALCRWLSIRLLSVSLCSFSPPPLSMDAHLP